jgi:hypothetical protein
MLTSIAIALFCLWLLGVVTGFEVGGFIHILLIVALIIALIRII